MRIQYITNVRIPTTRAQGYAIMKMCSEFSKSGVETVLSVPSRGNNKNKQDPFEYYKIDKTFKIDKIPSTDFLGMTPLFGKLFYWIDILSFLIALKFKIKILPDDVIYTRDFMTTLFFSRKDNIILELHDISSVNFLFKKALKKTNIFFVLNNNLKSDLVSLGVSADKIFVAPSGVDLKDFDVKESKEELRKRLDLPQDKKIVLYTGQFYKWKGVDTLAETAKLLPEDTFVFVGGAEPESSAFSKKYGNLKNIIIRSFQERYLVAPYLLASDVLVLPNSGKSKISSHYTSPLKLFEYMASRRPIVSSDLPSTREVLGDESAFFAKADDPLDFASVIKNALSDSALANKFAANAYERVGQFSWDKRAQGILEKIKTWI